ncbi:ABC transporter ATP-binding protein [Streptomyces sp. M19]
MAAAQRAYLGADEALAQDTGRTAAALRDIAAAGAAGLVTDHHRRLAERQADAARSLARWAALRSLALASASRLPAHPAVGRPWLTGRGHPGALVGALAYLTTALAPAIHALMTVLGTAGNRLATVLDRFTQPPPRPTHGPGRAADTATGPGAGPGHHGAAGRTARGDLRVRARLPTRTGGARPGHPARRAPRRHRSQRQRKSTLAAVLAAVERPTHGQVRWRGRPTDATDPTTLRTFLPQHAHVFSATLHDNLTYLRPDAPRHDVHAAIDALGLDPLAERLGGLATPIDPTRLSHGERQLIALARAHIAAAPLLILDEATSHLDPPRRHARRGRSPSAARLSSSSRTGSAPPNARTASCT